MMLDATQKYEAPLTKDRLCGWHAALFPMGSEKVHFTAPESKRLESEMNRFIQWFNSDNGMEPVIKSAISHLWFVSIHPFDDGNGRQDQPKVLQHVGSDNEIKKGSLDVSQWLVWYFERLTEALKATDETLSKVLVKARFWEIHKTTQLNERQLKMINILLGNFIGKMHSSKWAKMTNVHRDTARRDILNLPALLEPAKFKAEESTW